MNKTAQEKYDEIVILMKLFNDEDRAKAIFNLACRYIGDSGQDNSGQTVFYMYNPFDHEEEIKD